MIKEHFIGFVKDYFNIKESDIFRYMDNLINYPNMLDIMIYHKDLSIKYHIISFKNNDDINVHDYSKEERHYYLTDEYKVYLRKQKLNKINGKEPERS